MSINIMSQYTTNESIIYYNATLTNNEQLSYSTIPAEFTQSFQNPLIERAGDYDVCITRFAMSSQCIPFWAVPIQLGQSDPTLTPYGIQLQYYAPNPNISGSYYNVSLPDYTYLYWSSIETPPAYPAGPIQEQLLQNGYYFSYDKTDFISMFNNAMSDALVALRSAFATAYPADLNPIPLLNDIYRTISVNGTSLRVPEPDFPLLSYNESLQKFQILLNPALYANSTSASSGVNQPFGIRIYFNNLLFPLLQFPCLTTEYDRPNDLANSYRLEVFVENNFVLPSWYQYYQFDTTTAPKPPILQIAVYSDHNTLGVFSPLQSVYFTSNTLTTKPELGQPSTNPFTLTSPATVSSLVQSKILVDFEPNYQTTNSENRDYIQFNQSVNNSRLIGLQNSFESIKRIDLKLYWKDFNNNSYPVVLFAGCSVDCKIAFVPARSTS